MARLKGIDGDEGDDTETLVPRLVRISISAYNNKAMPVVAELIIVRK